MILYTKELVDKINNVYNMITVGGEVEKHGTFASGKVKYVTDIDLEDKIYYPVDTDDNRNKVVKQIQNMLQKVSSSDNIMFVKGFIGFDDRFDFGIDIEQSGSIIGYKKDDILEKLNGLVADNVLTKDELADLSKYVVN